MASHDNRQAKSQGELCPYSGDAITGVGTRLSAQDAQGCPEHDDQDDVFDM